MVDEVRIIPDQVVTLTVKIQVNNIAGVMSLYDQLRVYRSTTLDANGDPDNYTIVDTITLVANRPIYLYVDSTAPTDSWYYITYYNSTSLAETAPSTATQGVTSDALSLLSVDELKTNFLFGIDLTDDSGNPYPDSLFAFYIESAYAQLRNKLDIDFAPTFYQNEAYDFYAQDYRNYMFIDLDHIPVISVQSIKLVLPNNVEVIDYDLDWVYKDRNAGHIQIVPGNGQLILGNYYNQHLFMNGTHNSFPQAFQVTYTAGFENGKVPGNIKEAIGMLASMGPLGIAGDLLVGAGIASQSLSIDGLSQSINTTSSATNSGYGSRILQYQKALKDMIPAIYRAYHPINMVVG